MKHVTFMTAESHISPSWWRVLSPAQWMEHGEISVSVQHNYDTRNVPNSSTVVVLRGSCRNSWDIDRFLHELHSRDCLVVYDTDDDIVTPEFAIHQHRMYPGGWSQEQMDDELGEQTIRKWFIAHCDGVTVSTPHLKTIIQKYTNQPVIVVPNAIDVDWFLSRCRQQPARLDGEVYIGWAGSGRPLANFEEMAKAWQIIAEKYQNVYFMLGGWRPNNIMDRIPHDRLIFKGWKDLGAYAESYQVDIGCLPLENTLFNACKSPIKAMEYTLAGAAVIGSPTVYGDFISHEHTGYVAETTQEWVHYLSTLVENRADIRQGMNELMTAKIMSGHTMETEWYRWPKAYQDIKDMKDAQQAS